MKSGDYPKKNTKSKNIRTYAELSKREKKIYDDLDTAAVKANNAQLEARTAELNAEEALNLIKQAKTMLLNKN